MGIEKGAYTVQEIAAMTGFSRQTVTRMFEKEPGVLLVKRPETMHKRSYRSIRIPRAVYERVVRRLSVSESARK
jgi:predicted transcriptional regulator